jgi:GPI mannosyltransferase 2
MLSCARQNWFLAAILFSVAGTFRSNGILLAGFLWWGLIVQPVLDGQKV